MGMLFGHSAFANEENVSPDTSVFLFWRVEEHIFFPFCFSVMVSQTWPKGSDPFGPSKLAPVSNCNLLLQ